MATYWDAFLRCCISMFFSLIIQLPIWSLVSTPIQHFFCNIFIISCVLWNFLPSYCSLLEMHILIFVFVFCASWEVCTEQQASSFLSLFFSFTQFLWWCCIKINEVTIRIWWYARVNYINLFYFVSHVFMKIVIYKVQHLQVLSYICDQYMCGIIIIMILQCLHVLLKITIP